MTEKVELTPELLRELQLKQLDMLVYFRDFCEKNNLTFYLIGGALIGALRNGGFSETVRPESLTMQELGLLCTELYSLTDKE